MQFQQRLAETPFGQNTRHNRRTANTFNLVSGSRETQSVQRTGYLARINWHFNGTLTVTLGGGTAALDGQGPWNAMSRVKVSANAGTDIFNVSGYGAYLVEAAMLAKAGYVVGDSGLPAALGYSPQVYQAATAAGANTWDFGLTVPIAVNEESEIGLILLQNEISSIQLGFEYNTVYSLTASQAPVLVTGAAVATLTGTITPTLEYFSVPADVNARPDITWIHQLLETYQIVGSVGDQTVPLLRENYYLGLMHYLVLNNALNSTDVDRWRITLNKSETPYDQLKRDLFHEQRTRQGKDLPVGTFLRDLYYQGFPNFGGSRDFINGKSTSELESILTVASGAALGSNASRLATITRQIVRLTTPPVGGV